MCEQTELSLIANLTFLKKTFKNLLKIRIVSLTRGLESKFVSNENGFFSVTHIKNYIFYKILR